MDAFNIEHAPEGLKPYLSRLTSIPLERKTSSFLSNSFRPEESALSRHNVFYYSLSLLAILSRDTSIFAAFTSHEANWVATYMGLSLSDSGLCVNIPYSAWIDGTETERNELATKLATVGAGNKDEILLLSRYIHDRDLESADQSFTEGNTSVILRESIPSPFPLRTTTLALSATKTVIADPENGRGAPTYSPQSLSTTKDTIAEIDPEHGRAGPSYPPQSPPTTGNITVDVEPEHGREAPSYPPQSRFPSFTPPSSPPPSSPSAILEDVDFGHDVHYDPDVYDHQEPPNHEPFDGRYDDPSVNAGRSSAMSPTPAGSDAGDINHPTSDLGLQEAPLSIGILHERQSRADTSKACFRCLKRKIRCIQNRSATTASGSLPSCQPCKAAGTKCSGSDPAWYSNGHEYWTVFDKILELKRSMKDGLPDRTPPAPFNQLVTTFLSGLLVNRGLAFFASDRQFVEVNAMLEDAGMLTFPPRRP